MLINMDNTVYNVQFISYTGKYPNLCSGVLTLQIDGEICTFGNSYDTKTDFDKFWYSGGTCGFTNNYTNEYVDAGEWVIDVSRIPEQFRKYATVIDSLFNSNVRHGCCGGCL